MAERLSALTTRLDRAQAQIRREQTEGQARAQEAARRLAALAPRLTAERRGQLEALDRLRQTLGHTETLRRGFAIVRGPEGLVTSAAVAGKAASLELEFHDGRVRVHPEGSTPAPRRGAKKPPTQGSLF